MALKKHTLALAAFFALILPIIFVGCGGDNSDTSPQLTQTQIEDIVRAEVARAPTSPTLTQTEVEEFVATAIQEVSEPQLTRDDLEQAVEAALEETLTVMNSEMTTDPGWTQADVQKAVNAAIDNLTEYQPGLSAADVEQIVQSKLPEPGITLAEVQALVQQAIETVAVPAPGLTREEIRLLARNAVANIPLKSDPSEYTKFFVQNAISRYDEDGLQDTLAYYNSPASVDGQWYVTIVDQNDLVVGHFDSLFIGENLNGPIGTDAEGYKFGADMLSATNSGKWVSYVSQKPERAGFRTGDFEVRNVWVVEHDGLLFASGWNINADEFTQQLVSAAVNTFRTGGLEATLQYFSQPENALAGLEPVINYYNSAVPIDGQWSAFIANESGRFVAHSNPALIGSGVEQIFGTEIFFAPESGTWLTNEDVHVWVTSH